MLRRIVGLGMCALVVLAGCGKKAEPEKPTPTKTATVAPPAGMVAIAGSKPLAFISAKPVTNGEYTAYLDDSGQIPPDKTPDSAGPVTGLTLSEARDFAVWQLDRLPTKDEWLKASQIVGVKPYPWSEEPGTATTASRIDRQLFLVKDAEGPDAQQKAEQAKKALVDKMKGRIEEEKVKLQTEVDGLATLGPTIQSKWIQAKPGFYAAAQQNKELTEAAARGERLRTALDILGKLGEKKKALAAAKAADTGQDAMDKAAADYEKFVNQQRNNVAKLKDELTRANEKLQAKSLALKKDLDQAGPEAAEAVGAKAQALMEQVKAIDPQQLAMQGRKLAQLKAAIAPLRASADKLEEMLKKGETSTKSSDALKRKIAEVTVQQQETVRKVAQVEDALKGISENVGKEFAQEAALFKDLEDLAEAGARNKALDAEAAELDNALKTLKPADEK